MSRNKSALVCSLFLLTIVIITGFAMAEGYHDSSPKGAAKIDPDIPDLTSLNVRMSHQPIQIPKELLKESMDLPDVRAARSLIAPSPKAAILEDNRHHRVVILSAKEDGHVHAQVLEDLDFSAKIPFITTCSHRRRCAFDRQPVTGGLTCVAICVQQALNPEHDFSP